MRYVKSERLKKLESELADLEQWLKLGLVPKKDIEKHKEEIEEIRIKVEEEKQRLSLLKESGELEEIPAPKRPPGRSGYSEMPTIPDIDMPESIGGLGSESQFDMDNDSEGFEDSAEGDDEDEEEGDEQAEENEDSYFSDRNRWRHGGIIDPDADDW